MEEPEDWLACHPLANYGDWQPSGGDYDAWGSPPSDWEPDDDEPAEQPQPNSRQRPRPPTCQPHAPHSFIRAASHLNSASMHTQPTCACTCHLARPRTTARSLQPPSTVQTAPSSSWRRSTLKASALLLLRWGIPVGQITPSSAPLGTAIEIPSTRCDRFSYFTISLTTTVSAAAAVAASASLAILWPRCRTALS